MNKSDLKNGMVVETREGNKYILIGSSLCEKSSFLDLDLYNENLINKTGNSMWDIMKVYKSKYKTFLKNFLEDNLELLWERDEKKWNLIKKDTKVLVRNSVYDKWERRYFSTYIPYYKDAPFFTYPAGKDSWSSYSGTKQSVPDTRWKYCKLAEDNDEE